MSTFRNSASRPRSQKRFLFSRWSTPPVPNSGWSCDNFMMGAGMVIIQPSTNKVVVVYDTETESWFLPRGRKDMGETLQQAALREAYEESGYEVEFLPLYTGQRQPAPPNDQDAVGRPNTEAIYTTTTAWGAKFNRSGHITDPGGEYIVFWYVGQIPENAVHHEGVGMPDEQGYRSYLVTPQQALDLLHPSEGRVFDFAWASYRRHLDCVAYLEREAEERARELTFVQLSGEVDDTIARNHEPTASSRTSSR